MYQPGAGIEDRFYDMCGRIGKDNFDSRVAEFKKLLYGEVDGEDYRSTNVYAFDATTAITLIETYVSRFVSSLWDFSGDSFQLKSFLTREQGELSGDPEVAALESFYTRVKIRLNGMFADERSGFKNAFRQFVKDWYSLGTGVFLYMPVNKFFYTRSISPENAQWLYDEYGSLSEVIIKGKEGRNFYINTVKESRYDYRVPYAWIKRISEFGTTPIKWEIKKYKSGSDKHPYETLIAESYNPVFVSHYNLRSQNLVSYGKGLDVLPLIKTINNINKQMVEALTLAIKPPLFANDSVIAQENTKNNTVNSRYTQLELGFSVSRVEGGLTQSPTFVTEARRDFPAFFQYLDRLAGELIRALSPSPAMDSKKTARMHTYEVQVREGSDLTLITDNGSTIVDGLLLPLIYQAARVAMEYEKAVTPENRKAYEAFEVTLSNVMGDMGVAKRLTEIRNATGGLMEVSQLRQVGIDPSPLREEISRLLNVNINMTNSNVDLLSALTNEVADEAGRFSPGAEAAGLGKESRIG